MTNLPSLRRRTTAASVALLLGLTLAACGGSDDSDDETSDEPSSRTTETETTPDEPTSEVTEETSEPAVPTEDEIAAALLTAADLPEGFTAQPDDGDDDEDEDSFEGTCLADIGEFSDALGFEPDAESEVDLVAESQTGQSSVTSQIEAYSDPATVAPAFAEFTDGLGSCTSVETTDPDGVMYSLEISYDDTVDLPDAEDQLRIQMTGTIAAGGESYDVVYRFVVALTGPFISIVGAYSLGEDATGVVDGIDDLATLQAGRVAELG
ncbi:hypothetical protein [Nocardioides sp.]|uniref:hypothetical protein n=1 Tax=Nocardioides sp. TaxID=35761 RepID=UPI00271DC856|nr:hypothetical protein [Nocardioides sp.]MDO9457115.1 hypothetical protein [Nocardioides sp.]